jgi:hypothetical protein
LMHWCCSSKIVSTNWLLFSFVSLSGKIIKLLTTSDLDYFTLYETILFTAIYYK